MDFKLIIKYLLILCSMLLTCMYSTSYWEIYGIGLFCAIAVAIDLLTPLNTQIEEEDEARDELTKNNVQLTDHFLTENDIEQDVTPFVDPSQKFPDFEDETATSSTPENIGHIKIKNQEDLGETEAREVLHKLSDTCDATPNESGLVSTENFDLEKFEISEKEVVQNEDMKTSDDDLALGTKKAYVVTNETITETTEETPPTFPVDKHITEIPENYDEKDDGNENLTSAGVSVISTADCIDVFETPTPLFDAQCHTEQHTGDFPVEFETSNNIDTIPTTDCVELYEKSTAFLDGQFYTEHIGDSQVEFETSDNIDSISFVDEVATDESKRNWPTEGTFIPNEFINTPFGTENLTEEPVLKSDPKSADDDSKLKIEQTEELEERVENPKIKDETLLKKKQKSKFQAFKNRLWKLTSTKKTISGSEASTSRHVDHPENPQNCYHKDKVPKPKRKRRTNCCGCLPF